MVGQSNDAKDQLSILDYLMCSSCALLAANQPDRVTRRGEATAEDPGRGNLLTSLGTFFLTHSHR